MNPLFGTRVAAKFIDGCVAFFGMVIIGFVCKAASIPDWPALVFFFGYFAISDSLSNGQSFGKVVMKLKVVSNTTNKKIGIIRSSLRALPALTIWPVELVLIAASGNRIGDIGTKTRVIATKPAA